LGNLKQRRGVKKMGSKRWWLEMGWMIGDGRWEIGDRRRDEGVNGVTRLCSFGDKTGK